MYCEQENTKYHAKFFDRYSSLHLIRLPLKWVVVGSKTDLHKRTDSVYRKEFRHNNESDTMMFTEYVFLL